MNIDASYGPPISRAPWGNEGFKAGDDIGRLSADLEKEEEALSELSREMIKHISRGEQDMAQLKSTLLQQKQLQVQTIRRDMERLQHPERSGNAQTAAFSSSENALRTASLPLPEQPAADGHWSAYAQNLLSRIP